MVKHCDSMASTLSTLKEVSLHGGKKKGTVAIVGAGVAGCAMAAALRDYRIDCVVYDKNPRPGGLWVNNYPGAKVQSTFELYEYPCKKFPEHIRNRQFPPAPTAEEVCTYLEEFIEEKGIKNKFRFNHKIDDIRQNSDDEWVIEFTNGQVEKFSFVIVCAGIVSVKPKIIDIPGREQFEWNGGEIIHSSQRRNDAWFKGRKVLVIGNGKSAADAASIASKHAKRNGTKAPIQAIRRATWYVPRYILGFIQYKWFFHTRLGSALLPRYYETTNRFLCLLHSIFSPIKWLVWRLVELLLLLHYRLPVRLQPKMGTILRNVLDISVLITGEDHLSKIRNREIDMRVATVDRLEPGKAILSTGEAEEVDVIVMATGWELGFDTFMDKHAVLKNLLESDGVWLYRNILPPNLKGIAFVGSNTLTFMNIYTSYIQAYWLAGLMAKERPWPKRSHMEETIAREKAFKRKYYPEHSLRGASVEGYMQHYHDVLFQEMGARKPFNFFIRPVADLIIPVVPSVMKGTLEPTKKTRKKLKMQKEARRSKPRLGQVQ